MEPLFLPRPTSEEIKTQFQRGIKQIASASININGPCETWNFKGALSAASEWKGKISSMGE